MSVEIHDTTSYSGSVLKLIYTKMLMIFSLHYYCQSTHSLSLVVPVKEVRVFSQYQNVSHYGTPLVDL